MNRYRPALAAFLLHTSLALSLPLAPPALADGGLYSVYYNGTHLPGHPLVRDGVGYLPINTLAQYLNLNIRWDSSLNVVKVDNQVLAARPLNEEGRIYLPIEAVAQSVGGAVEWDGRTQVIRVTSGTRVASSTPPSAAGAVPVAAQPVSASPLPSAAKTSTATPATKASRVSVTPAVSVGGSVTPIPGGGPEVPAAVPSPQPIPRSSTVSLAPILPVAASRTPDPTPGPARATVADPTVPAPAFGNGSVYVPKSGQNNVFAVTVTNVETAGAIKDFYHPRPGYRFVIVYLSQQNVSNEVQIYTGRFSLLDQNGQAHEYVEGLSNFWLVILRPYGINFGYLVFEMPVESQPTRIALHALNQAPLTLNL
jgi:Copper amine oxidase N-terminal domain